MPGSLPGNLYAFLIYSSPKASEVDALTDVEAEAWRGLCSGSFSPRGAAAQVQSWCLTSEPVFILPALRCFPGTQGKAHGDVKSILHLTPLAYNGA